MWFVVCCSIRITNTQNGCYYCWCFMVVVVCLMIRKTVSLMNYVQAHQNVFRQLVDLIGITSIMEVLVRLLGADDHVYPNFIDVMQWLAESNLLEMIVDKLSPSFCRKNFGLCIGRFPIKV
ncbi:unnamed protein product [Lathyrus sativus]|nr:unnamed protein product [Lathyrus sativus]